MKNRKSVSSIIWRTIKKKSFLSAGIVFAVAASVVTALLPPLILGKVIDMITAGQEPALILIFSYFGLTALTGFSESFREGLLTVFGQKITHALRSSLMDKYTHLTADSLTGQEPGAVVSRFVGDVDVVEKLFTSGIISMFADAIKIISILVVIWVENRGLAIVLAVILPFLFWFTRRVQKSMLVAQVENRRAVGRASGCVPETLHNIRTIHCLQKEKYMTERYDRYIGESYRAVERSNFCDAIYSPVILILNAVVVAVVMLLSASGNAQVLMLFGMSAGTAVAVINYISQIFGPVESLGMEIQTIQSAIAGVHRINEFLGLEEKEEVTGRQEALQQSQAAVREEDAEQDEIIAEFQHVTFGYREQDILQDFSFQIRKGEQITLAGRTGSGKSTIFKLLLGLYEPKKGSVLIKGRRAGTVEEKEKRKLFGYVEQTFHQVPGTVRDQITLFDPAITPEMAEEAARLAGLHETVMALEKGYDTPCMEGIFSEGQWQLLSIARAVAARPKILLLDEITANLDAQTEKEVLQALQRAADGRTVISISHRVNARMGRVITVRTINKESR